MPSSSEPQIGGLTAAVALHRKGWRVTVLERAADLAPVGGIGLAPNSQRALDVIGLGNRVRDLAAWQGDGGMRTPDGRWLARTDAKAAAARFGGPLVLLHRATLVEILASALPDGAVRTGAAATLLDPGDDRHPARLATPEGEVEAALVVAADGIRSATRHSLFPEHPGLRYAGCTTWRLVVPAPERPFAPHETWGAGRLWGTQPLKDGRIYAYAMATAPMRRSRPRRREGRTPAPLRRLAPPRPRDPRSRRPRPGPAPRRPPPARPAACLPPGQGRPARRRRARDDAQPRPGREPGDRGRRRPRPSRRPAPAAHPTRAAPGFLPSRALAAYTGDRLPRTTAIVRKAARTGALTMLAARPAVALRSTLVGAVSRFGPGLVLRGFDGIADWHPPVAQARSA